MQIAVLGLMAIGAVLAITRLANSQASAASASLERSNKELLPVERILQRAEDEHAKSVKFADTMFLDGGGLTPAGLDFLVMEQSLTSTLTDYQQASVNLPGEAVVAEALGKDPGAVRAALTEAYAVSLGGVKPPVSITEGAFNARAEHLQKAHALYAKALSRSTAEAGDLLGSLSRDTRNLGLAMVVILAAAFVLATGMNRSRERALRAREQSRLREGARSELETRLQRALEMSDTEDDAFELVTETLAEGNRCAELLVADSSRAHLRQVAASGNDGLGPGCGVGTPHDCPAATRGQSQVYVTSERIDACPYLRHRPEGSCSAGCIPVSIAGKSVGVLHATAPVEQPVDTDLVADLELLARKVGDRVGMLRAFNRSENQARTDPLTGLLNRRSLETMVARITEAGTPFVVAFGDLDRFKDLNDVFGHDAGDRALRIFSRVLRDNVRPSDIAARYGGEEFVVVLPDCSLGDAQEVVERVRQRLAEDQGRGSSPPVTVSFGLAPFDPTMTFSDAVAVADGALLLAKQNGRDRVVIAEAGLLPDPASDTVSS